MLRCPRKYRKAITKGSLTLDGSVCQGISLSIVNCTETYGPLRRQFIHALSPSLVEFVHDFLTFCEYVGRVHNQTIFAVFIDQGGSWHLSRGAVGHLKQGI